MFEGGVRAASFIWSPLLKNRGRVSDQIVRNLLLSVQIQGFPINHLLKKIHINDWLPTLIRASGSDPNSILPPMDGMDLWESISKGKEGKGTMRNMVVHGHENNRAIRLGKWKYVESKLRFRQALRISFSEIKRRHFEVA